MAGDEAGRDEVLRLFLKHQVMLSAFLFSLTEDWELVEESLQETAIFVCSRWQDFTPGTNFGAWTRSVAHMRCREVIENRRRAKGLPLDAMLHDTASSISEHEWEHYAAHSPREKEALSRCVQSLPPEHLQLVELRYGEGHACEKIALQLTKSVDAIYMSLSRIRKRLRECVKRRMAGEMA